MSQYEIRLIITRSKMGKGGGRKSGGKGKELKESN